LSHGLHGEEKRKEKERGKGEGGEGRKVNLILETQMILLLFLPFFFYLGTTAGAHSEDSGQLQSGMICLVPWCDSTHER
jgi:hypothetical protein